MTPEQAMYHMLMLKQNMSGAYEAELDRLLEEQDSLSPLVLELAFCMSDRRETISVLHNFLLEHPADEEQVCDRILSDMTRCYLDKSMTPEEITSLLCRCAMDSDRDYWEEPWSRLYDFTYDLEMYEDGLISRSVFLTGFEERLLQNQRPDIWAMQAEENTKKPRWGFFRKHKNGESP